MRIATTIALALGSLVVSAAAAQALTPPSVETQETPVFAVQAKDSKLSLSVGGEFEIQRISQRAGTFRFTGVSRQIKLWHDVITVNADANGNVRAALVKRMAQLIREEYPGQFYWKSKRLARAVLLSAAPEDSEQLESFLMLEFFEREDAERAAPIQAGETKLEEARQELARLPATAPEEERALLAKQLEIARLEKQIAERLEELRERTKRKFVGARPSEYRFALYVDAWRKRIEDVGNRNYPEEAKKQRLSGSIQLTIAILPDGQIASIEINRSSGNKLLDQSAIQIARMAAPYDRFPESIRADTDILHITRTWTFLHLRTEHLAALTIQ